MALSGCVQQSPSREKCTFSLLSQIPAEMEENFTSIKKEVSDIFYFFNINLFNWRLITLQYCIGFAIHQHDSTTGIHVFPILKPPPSPYHPSGSSQCTSPKHPVSCIKPGLVIRFIYDMFQCHSPKSSHPCPLPQSPKDCSILLCLF